MTRLGNVTAPLVSVGITTYRRPHFLVEAIGSVLQQTLKDLEIIICDDHSLDGTEEVVRRLNDGRIRYHCNRENLGMTRNINQCIRLARGKYFCWNSDDNVYLPRFLERLVGALESCPETGAAACSSAGGGNGRCPGAARNTRARAVRPRAGHAATRTRAAQRPLERRAARQRPRRA